MCVVADVVQIPEAGVGVVKNVKYCFIINMWWKITRFCFILHEMHVAVVEEYVKNLNTYLEMKINIKINNTSHNSDSFLQNYGLYFDKKRDLIKLPSQKIQSSERSYSTWYRRHMVGWRLLENNILNFNCRIHKYGSKCFRTYDN